MCGVIARLVVAVIILIVASRLAYVHLWSRRKRHDIATATFNTGDILMFKHEAPIAWRDRGHLNTDMCVDKLASHAVQYFAHGGWPFTHAAVVVMVGDQPYLLELTRRPTWDEYRGAYVIASPSFHHLSSIGQYEGHVYHYRFRGACCADVSSVLARIHADDIMLTNEPVSMFARGRLIGEPSHQYKYTCTDFAWRVLYELGIVAGRPRRTTNISDIMRIIRDDPRYEKDAILLGNAYARAVVAVL